MDDFLYLCDDAYTHDELLKMEQDILKVVGYDINIPVAYRFLRRLARVSTPPHHGVHVPWLCWLASPLHV